MRVLFAAALAAAVPASASDPTFRFGVACDGGLPVVIQVEAVRAGVTRLTLHELMEFCAERRPIKHRWQGGA